MYSSEIHSRPSASRLFLGNFARALTRNPLGWPSAFIVLLLIVVGTLAPWIAPYPPDMIVDLPMPSPPNAQFLLGADEIGRDVLSRIIAGTSVSLRVMVLSLVISIAVGSVFGLIAGYFRGVVESVIMRIMDALLAFPMLVLALAIIAFLGPGINNAIIAIGIVNVPKFARLVRGEVLGVSKKEFVTAARSLGYGNMRIMFRHIWPNVAGSVIVYASISASHALITEAALSFLGLGVQPPDPSWGIMIATGMSYLSEWWISFFPGLAIFLTVLSLNVFGDVLRDVLDPRDRQ